MSKIELNSTDLNTQQYNDTICVNGEKTDSELPSSKANDSSNDNEFKDGDFVVYPSHGVGRITGIENQEIAGHLMSLYVIEFSEESMILRVPKSRAFKAGLRSLSSLSIIEEAIEILKQRPQNNRGMWSKRSQEYYDKINSGDILQIAQVLRDLFRNLEENVSYSERLVYECAFERLISEYSKVMNISREEASSKIIEILEAASILTAAA